MVSAYTEQLLYLQFLEPADTSIYSGTLEPCDDCTSSEIVLPADFPFGGYFHQTAYVTNMPSTANNYI